MKIPESFTAPILIIFFQLIDYDFNLQCNAQNVTDNTILYHLQYGALGRPRCSSEGPTTSTHMTPSGLNQYLKKLKRNKCTLGMYAQS